MKQFYLLERYRPSVGEATTDFLPVAPYNTSSAPRCEACGKVVAMRRWEPPFRVEIATWGIKVGDMCFGPGDSFLVSERFKTLWEEAGLVGLHGFEPVEIVKVRRRGKRIKEAPPQYFRVWAERSEVAVDPVRSGIQWVSAPAPACEACREGGIMKGHERIVLEGKPQENVFTPRGFGVILVDDCFKRFCEENAITNCPLIPAEQASRWF